jgi:4-oxalocrotonate tautomerase
MPFVNVKLVDGVFSTEEKHALAKALTMSWSSSRARSLPGSRVGPHRELHTDGWHIGGRPFAGPKSLKQTLENSRPSWRRSTANRPRAPSGQARRRFGTRPTTEEPP